MARGYLSANILKGDDMNNIAIKEQEVSLISMLERMVMSPDIDVTKLEKMLDMQERIINKQAEQDWINAMTQAQADMPDIVATSENKQTVSKYAKYEAVNKQAKPVYVKNGFSLSFGQDESVAGTVRVICDVAHQSGHSRRYHVDLEPDTAGIKGTTNKTAVHGVASTLSYGKRYLLVMIFNITIVGEDDDGNSAGGDSRSALEIHNDHCAYMALVRDLWPSISAIKEGIATKDYSAAIEALNELTDEEKKALWKAPTKGGIFSTEERAAMKSDEWSQARTTND